MKQYVKCTTSYLSDDEIVDRFVDYGLELTSEPEDAIWLLRDGTLICGVYEDIRSEDHRCAECLIDDLDRYDNNFWDEVFKRTGMIALVPETCTAWLSPSQHVTPKQKQILNYLHYDIERS